MKDKKEKYSKEVRVETNKGEKVYAKKEVEIQLDRGTEQEG